MMANRYSVLSAFAMTVLMLLELQSCRTVDDSPSLPVPDTSHPIEFGMCQDGTKGFDPINHLYDLNKTGFGVFAGFSQRGEQFDRNTHACNYIENLLVNEEEPDGLWVPMTQSGTNFTPLPTYWPLMGSLTFFGYAPYVADTKPFTGKEQILTMPSEDYVSGMLRGTFRPSKAVTSQIDFCVAPTQFNRRYPDGPVPMEFKHALTRVRFYVNGDGELNPHYRYRITQLRLSGVLGENSFTYTDDPDMPCKWDHVDKAMPRTAEYNMYYTESEHLTEEWVKLIGSLPEDAEGLDRYSLVNSKDNGRLYLLPQNLTDQASLLIVVTIYQLTDPNNWQPISVLAPMEVPLPTDTDWEPGKTVSYLITIPIPDFKVVKVKALVTDWEDSGNNHPTQILD